MVTHSLTWLAAEAVGQKATRGFAMWPGHPTTGQVGSKGGCPFYALPLEVTWCLLLEAVTKDAPDSREGDTAPLLSRGSTLYEEPGTSRTYWCSHLWKM